MSRSISVYAAIKRTPELDAKLARYAELYIRLYTIPRAQRTESDTTELTTLARLFGYSGPAEVRGYEDEQRQERTSRAKLLDLTEDELVVDVREEGGSDEACQLLEEMCCTGEPTTRYNLANNPYGSPYLRMIAYYG